MNKKEFLAKLCEGLSDLPRNDIEERLTFYSEMIEDQMEEGLTEEDAVLAVGAVEEIVSQIKEDTPPKKTSKQKEKLKVWEIVILVLGSPIWLSLLIAIFAVILSVYLVLWTIIICLWAIFAAVAGCALGGIVGGVGFAFGNNPFSGIAMISAGLVCTGLAILLFLGCKAATKGLLLLTKNTALWVKNRYFKKEEA